MTYETDFVTQDLVTLEIIGGRKFSYKPTTGGDENEWLNDIMKVDAETKKPVFDWAAYNRKKFERITAVPYTAEEIKKATGSDKPWEQLSGEQRYGFLSKLRSGIFDALTQAIKKVDEGDGEAVKN